MPNWSGRVALLVGCRTPSGRVGSGRVGSGREQLDMVAATRGEPYRKGIGSR